MSYIEQTRRIKEVYDELYEQRMERLENINALGASQATVDDPENYWFTPHTVNPTPGVVPNSGYIGESSLSQKSFQEELNKLHDQRIDRFEELLDQFDTLHAEFGE